MGGCVRAAFSGGCPMCVLIAVYVALFVAGFSVAFTCVCNCKLMARFEEIWPKLLWSVPGGGEQHTPLQC